MKKFKLNMNAIFKSSTTYYPDLILDSIKATNKDGSFSQSFFQLAPGWIIECENKPLDYPLSGIVWEEVLP